MSGRRRGERKMVIRSKGCISREEMRKSILKHLLQEYEIQKYTIQENNQREHHLQECDTAVAMGRGSGSDAGDRE